MCGSNPARGVMQYIYIYIFFLIYYTYILYIVSVGQNLCWERSMMWLWIQPPILPWEELVPMQNISRRYSWPRKVSSWSSTWVRDSSGLWCFTLVNRTIGTWGRRGWQLCLSGHRDCSEWRSASDMAHKWNQRWGNWHQTSENPGSRFDSRFQGENA